MGQLVLTMAMVMLPGGVPEVWAGWTPKAPMPTARTWLSVAEVNGILGAPDFGRAARFPAAPMARHRMLRTTENGLYVA